MGVIVGFVRSPEGRVALERAIDEAKLRGVRLTIIHSHRGSEKDELETVLSYREEFEQLEAKLTAAGVDHKLIEFARDNSPAEDLIQAAKEVGADLIVIGIRRRSPVGKLILGSNAQDVLLTADCAVLAVKAPEDE
jgi:nucleotide-binding universal stress UspA family protein